MVVYDQVSPMALAPSPVPWRPALLLNILGLYCFETGVELIQKAMPKPKAGAAKQQVSSSGSLVMQEPLRCQLVDAKAITCGSNEQFVFRGKAGLNCQN